MDRHVTHLFYKFIHYLWLISILVFTSSTFASVTMLGTRFIYPEGIKSKTLYLTNDDVFFNVVQLWVDVNNPDSTPDDADAPFIVTPPIFRMEPSSGQSARLTYTGQLLPQDRESVFYLNMLQIPPVAKRNAGKSAIQMTFRHRMKVFYRPKGLKDKPENVIKSQTFNITQDGNKWLVNVKNPTSYYATFRSAHLNIGTKKIPIEIPMISPQSSESVTIEKAGPLPNGSIKVDFVIVNDIGKDNPEIFVIQR